MSYITIGTDQHLLTLNSSFIEFNKQLYYTRFKTNQNIDRASLYEETVSISTDIIFILICHFKGLKYLTRKVDIAEIKNILINDFNRDISNEVWESLDEKFKTILNLFNSVQLSSEVQRELLSLLVEDSWEKNEATSKNSRNGSSNKRRDYGSYYTQNCLTEVIIKETIDKKFANKSLEEARHISIIDPAVGSGAFLLAALDRIKYHLFINTEGSNDKNSNEIMVIIENCIFGVDINPTAVNATVYALWLEIDNPNYSMERLKINIVVGDSLLGILPNNPMSIDDVLNPFIFEENDIYKESEARVFDWKYTFNKVFESSNGFDIVLGNPPWNKLKAHIKEFFLHYDEALKNMQGKKLKDYINSKYLSNSVYKRKWENHKRYIELYSDTLNRIGQYKYQSMVVNDKNTGGEKDFYKLFLELSYNILNENGLVGLILPASFIQSEGSTALRKLLIDNTSINLLTTVTNKEKLFPIDSRFKYAFLVYEKNKKNHFINAKFMVDSVEEIVKDIDKKSLLKLSPEFIKLLSPSYLTIPDIKSQYEVSLLNKIYKNIPLINSETGWKISFKRELDMTNDSHLFIHTLEKESYDKFNLLPLYEGRMVNQFDYRAKKYIGGEGRQSKWERLNWHEKELEPHFYVKEEDICRKDIKYNESRVAFCDIAGQTNMRAVQTSLLPTNTVAGNKVPIIEIKDNNLLDKLLFVGISNSFVFDWLMRMKISTTINFFHWSQVPLPTFHNHSIYVYKIITNVAKLNLVGLEMSSEIDELKEHLKLNNLSYDVEPVIDPKERQYLRAEIDAIVAKSFGLNNNDLGYILHHFPLLDKSQPPIAFEEEESKSYITRDLILQYFSELNNIKNALLKDFYNENESPSTAIENPNKMLSERINKAFEEGSIAYFSN